MVQGGGEGWWKPSLEFLKCCSISKRFGLQWKGFNLLYKMRYILLGGGAAGGQWRHQQWSPSLILKKIRNQVKTPINGIIIRSKFFFLFIGRKPATWPANNCLQIMVCSYAMPSICVWLQIIFCSCVQETALFSFLRSLLRENGRSLRFPRIFIKKTNNYWTRLSQNIVICQITIFCSTSSSNC